MTRNRTVTQKRPGCRGRFSGRLRILLIILPLMVVVSLLLISILSKFRRSQENLARVRIQDSFVQDVELHGGRVVLAPAEARGAPRAVLSVVLSDATIDGDLIERLSRFTTIERLNVDGAELASEEYLAIIRLTKLRKLSLAGSTFSDEDLPLDVPQLTTLSLRNTSITDTGLSRLAEMTNLAILDITGTSVTAEGLKALPQLSSLKTLELDDACITQDSVLALQSMKLLKVIPVHVTDGLGRQVKELMSPLAGSATVQGLHPSGNVLWHVEKPWEETLAGVVEAVTDEVDLEPQQVAQLIDVIGSDDMARQRTENYSRGIPQFEPNGKKLESVDEFLQRLHDPEYPSYEVRAFARDRFTKNDVPKLLDALRVQTNLRDAEYLHRYGSYLLVRDGIENSEAVRELERMLSHEDPRVRSITVYAFDQYGHPFREDWAPSEAAVEFGLPWLLKLSKDPDRLVKSNVSEVLGDLAYHHPNRAQEAMSVLVGMLERGLHGYTNYSIKRIVEVNPEAARAFIPQLLRLLEKTDAGTIAAQLHKPPRESAQRYILQALCDVAGSDPEAAHEVAVYYVGLVRERKSAGHWLPTLVAPENSEAVRTIVHELLEISTGDDPVAAELGQHALAPVAKAIRDFRAAGI